LRLSKIFGAEFWLHTVQDQPTTEINASLQFEKLQCSTKENTINKKMNKIRWTKYRKKKAL